MTARFGIDTSILVRLATGDPEDAFERCLALRGVAGFIQQAGVLAF